MSRRKEYIENNKIETNATTIFLLPTLGFNKKFFGDEFIGAYLVDVLKPKLALIFNNNTGDSLNETLDILKSHDAYVDSFYDDNNMEIVVNMLLPSEYRDDLLKFKKGRYKEFSSDLKDLLLETHGRVTGAGKGIYMVDVLYPDWRAKKYKADMLGVTPNDLPNGEVHSVPDPDKERYIGIEELIEGKIKYGNKQQDTFGNNNI